MKANGVFVHNEQTQPGKNVSFPVNLGVSVSPGCLNQRGRAVSAYSLAPRPGTPGSVEKLALQALCGHLSAARCAQLSVLWSDVIFLAPLLKGNSYVHLPICVLEHPRY